MNEDVPQSPCISVCILDENNICTGCYRSAVEVADWLMASAGEKREILRRVEQRRRAAGVL